MGKFEVKEVKSGIKFNLKAGNGEIIAVSEIYTTEKVPLAERLQFHGPLLKRTRCQHTSLKENLWIHWRD